MEELLSAPVVLSGMGAATVLFGSVLTYFEGLLGDKE